MTTQERWLPIPGMRGYYEASDQGHIRSWKTYRGKPGPRLLVPMSKGRGKRHLMFFAIIDGKRRPTLVHRAVLAAFVGPCPPGQEVRHLDGDASNNRLENLAYGTHSENELDKVRHGTHRHAGKTHCKRGHEFTPENTHIRDSGRLCLACRRMMHAAGERRRRRERAAASQ